MDHIERSWDLEEAKREALAFLHSPERLHISARRIENEIEDVIKSATAGRAILASDGAQMLQTFIKSETDRFVAAQQSNA